MTINRHSQSRPLDDYGSIMETIMATIMKTIIVGIIEIEHNRRSDSRGASPIVNLTSTRLYIIDNNLTWQSTRSESERSLSW